MTLQRLIPGAGPAHRFAVLEIAAFFPPAAARGFVTWIDAHWDTSLFGEERIHLP